MSVIVPAGIAVCAQRDMDDDERLAAKMYEPTARAVLAALTGVPHD